MLDVPLTYILALINSQVLRTLTYYNRETEPAGQVTRQLTIAVDVTGFQPCTVDISVLDLPDAPVIHLPNKSVWLTLAM